MKPGGLSFLLALGLAAAVTLALLGWTCRYDSRDACLIMQGISVYLGPALLLVLWPLAYGGCLIVRAIRNPPK